MRLLSLICLAQCAAALPDIGVTYAATGRLNVLMAAESVRRLSTRYAHVHLSPGKLSSRPSRRRRMCINGHHNKVGGSEASTGMAWTPPKRRGRAQRRVSC